MASSRQENNCDHKVLMPQDAILKTLGHSGVLSPHGDGPRSLEDGRAGDEIQLGTERQPAISVPPGPPLSRLVRLDRALFRCYWNYRMINSAAVTALSALAHDHRLAIYRLLVQAGSEGQAAGAIAEKLDMAPSSLSFHLAHLTRAGLIDQRRESRSLIYSADFAAMSGLVGFLTENCCGGASCAPATSQKRKAS